MDRRILIVTSPEQAVARGWYQVAGHANSLMLTTFAARELTHNAGVKWEIQPARGGRAKRIRWYRRTKEYQPQQFFQTLRRG